MSRPYLHMYIGIIISLTLGLIMLLGIRATNAQSKQPIVKTIVEPKFP